MLAKQNGVAVGQYGYDWTGRRVTRDTLGSGPTTRDYVFDLEGRLLAEHDGAGGAVVKEYVWLDDMPLAVIDRASGSPVVLAIHTGHLDEPLVMTDAAGAKVWNVWHEPFGAASAFGTASAALDLRLPGQMLQLETGGLHQNWMRDYDPSTARYIQPDPLGLAAGQNVYAYVAGDPLNAVDPDGLQGLIRPMPRPSTRGRALGSSAMTPIGPIVPAGAWTPRPGSSASRITFATPPGGMSFGARQSAQAEVAGICLAPGQPGAPWGIGPYAKRSIPGYPGRPNASISAQSIVSAEKTDVTRAERAIPAREVETLSVTINRPED